MIWFIGDVHGDFRKVVRKVAERSPPAVVFLGDLQPREPLERVLAPILGKTGVWFIHGNHDTETEAEYDNLFGSRLADRNLHGRVAEIAGLRVAGLGGVFHGKIWDPRTGEVRFRSRREFDSSCGKGDLWRGGLPLHLRSAIFHEEFEQLARQKADILVTHEAPGCHPYGFDAIDVLAMELGAKKVFHGHQHDRLDYSGHEAKTGHRVFGVGLRGITDLEGNVILPGELDEARRGRQEFV